jgi:hypothetical protein
MTKPTASPRPETKDNILERVRLGKISPCDAEQQASQLGIVLSHAPDPPAFDPLQEREWTLPMTASWVIERSLDAVRERSDRYRVETRDWVPRLAPRDGYDLKPGEPTTLFSIFYEAHSTALNAVLDGEHSQQNPRPPDYNEGACPAARDLRFALRSGGLKASGLLDGEQSRSPIRETAWRGPIERHINPRAPDALYAAVGDDHFYRKVLVSREDVFAIWPRRTPIAAEDSSLTKHFSIIQPAPTLPPNFHRPDWSLEQVLAWLRLRDMGQLRGLEISDSDRPAWYGRICRHGYIDQTSETALRDALICELLVARRGDRERLPGAWWRECKLTSIGEEVWFRRDEVFALWPSRDDRVAQTGESVASGSLDESDSTPPGGGEKRAVGRPKKIGPLPGRIRATTDGTSPRKDAESRSQRRQNRGRPVRPG